MKLTLNIHYYDIWGWAVVLGMAAFALWAFYDGLEIGSLGTAWRFLLFFAILLAPTIVTLTLFGSKKR